MKAGQVRLCYWHFVLWPEHDGDLAAFMQRLTITHVRRWQEHRGEVGVGHVYQGRYMPKSFPIQTDEYVLTSRLPAMFRPNRLQYARYF